MENLWKDSDAKAAIAQHAKKGIGEDLGLRVYTTRLLGGEPRLVLHGGGNTSVKTRMPDITGTTIDVLCVKGSGWRRCANSRACRRSPTRTWSMSSAATF